MARYIESPVQLSPPALDGASYFATIQRIGRRGMVWYRSRKSFSSAYCCMAYRLEVKRRDPHPPTPYKWEIYEDDEPLWVEQSVESFPSKGKAVEAGTEALLRLKNRKAQNRCEGGNRETDMPGKPWTDKDDVKLKTLAQKYPTAEIAKRLGRSCGATIARAFKLRVSLRRPRQRERR